MLTHWKTVLSQPTTLWKEKVVICQEIQTAGSADHLPELLPLLAGMLHDAKRDVTVAAKETLEMLCHLIDNRDLTHLMPQLIGAMVDPTKVEDTIHALSATTFVQSVTAPVLALLVPLLVRGVSTGVPRAIQRKSCVILENMAKLVDNIEDVRVFLPQLVPLVRVLEANASNPENRAVAKRTLETLDRVLAKALSLGNEHSTAQSDDIQTDYATAQVLCDCEFSLAYGAKILLKNAKLTLKRGFRYGLCGANGIGKSTLLRAISSDQLDGFPKRDVLKTVYMEHDIDADQSEQTALQYIMALASAADEATARAELTEKGFDEQKIQTLVGSLSGGWKMKLALTRALLEKPDILLLDEPTNHLDVTNVAWLQDYLITLGTQGVTCIIVSHDSGFLDAVCTHILHYMDYKLDLYHGNLSTFVKHYPAAASYYSLEASITPFKFPEPGFLEGVKTKDKAILKALNIGFHYPCEAGTERWIFKEAQLYCNLCSRIAILGPNGAGKSTLIKVLLGEYEPTLGTVWRHPSLRIAYVAQHAFHHIEKHLDKTPMQYFQWRFATGEDREKEDLAIHQLSEAEAAAVAAKFVIQGEKRVIETLVARRKSGKSYEYEVQWKGLTSDKNTWFEREELETMGFSKWVQEMDQKEATRLGVVTRPLTAANIAQSLEDVGLDKEVALHSKMAGLSGGQKVKVVLGAAMWLCPHLLILDEPTNYLDRDSLGGLAAAIRQFGGGVLIITHHGEFSEALCKETWTVAGDGRVAIQREGVAVEPQKLAAVQQGEQELTDALGNKITIKHKKSKASMSNKELKKLAKEKKARRERGEEVSSDEDDD